MTTAPKILYVDGSGSTTNLTITTNIYNMIFRGLVDPNTIDIQIDFNGSGFFSEPSLVGLNVPSNLSTFSQCFGGGGRGYLIG